MEDPLASVPAMSAYGVGGEDWAPLPWSWAASRLAAARNYWLVTVSGSGRPHALPVWGAWAENRHRFFFSCAQSSRKASNLEVNPRVVVAPEDTAECVSLEGTARPVVDVTSRRDWVDLYVAKYRAAAPDLSGEFLLANAMFEVTPDRAFAVIEREKEFATRATRWTF